MSKRLLLLFVGAALVWGWLIYSVSFYCPALILGACA
jgi:hypothetical protein